MTRAPFKVAVWIVPVVIPVLVSLSFWRLRLPPVAVVRVVGQKGQPVSEATLLPDGLRPKNNGGHYGWSAEHHDVKPLRAITDKNGVARISYPRFVHERLETEQISLAVEHPDFCPERPFVTVDASPPANAPLLKKFAHLWKRLLRQLPPPSPITLRRGAVVEITVEGQTSLEDVHVQVTDAWSAAGNLWKPENGLLVSRRIAEGSHELRVVHLRREGGAQFGGPVRFTAKAGETNRLSVKLEEALALRGRYDESVPRPVAGGIVAARIFTLNCPVGQAGIVWMTWAPVAVDGTFQLTNVPPGRLELIGLCDGYLSQNDPNGPSGRQKTPQVFPLAAGSGGITLLMERGAAFEATVLDDAGRPVRDAVVGFWPNVRWNDHGSTIFAEPLFDSMQRFGQRDKPKAPAGSGERQSRFSARTDERGVALIRTLPAGKEGYVVMHPEWELPVVTRTFGKGRERDTVLAPGETNRVTVRMQKKGREFVTH